MSPGTKIIVFLAGVIVLAGLAFVLPLTDWLASGLQWIDANPGIAWIVYILVYIIATVLLIPGSILTMGAGFLFPLPVGVILVSISSVTGASLAFLIGRFFARDWIAGKISTMQRFSALDRAIGEQGMLIVFLARLSPVFPFNLLNYGLGLTRVRFWHYVLASWIGMLPATILYVYLGTAAKSLVAIVEGDIPTGNSPRYFLIAGLVATIVLVGLITRIATKALKTKLDAGEEEGV